MVRAHVGFIRNAAHSCQGVEDEDTSSIRIERLSHDPSGSNSLGWIKIRFTREVLQGSESSWALSPDTEIAKRCTLHSVFKLRRARFLALSNRVDHNLQDRQHVVGCNPRDPR